MGASSSSEASQIKNNNPKRRKNHGTDECQALLLGDGGVGKTAYLYRYMTNMVDVGCDYLDDRTRKVILLDDEVAVVTLIDTTDQEEFRALLDHYYRNVKYPVILFFSPSSRASFVNLHFYVEQLLRARELDTPMDLVAMVIGQKCDLEAERQVEFEEAASYARQFGWLFFEASALKIINISESMESFIRLIRKKRGAQ